MGRGGGGIKGKAGGGGGANMFGKVFFGDLPHITTPPRKVVF